MNFMWAAQSETIAGYRKYRTISHNGRFLFFFLVNGNNFSAEMTLFLMSHSCLSHCDIRTKGCDITHPATSLPILHLVTWSKSLSVTAERMLCCSSVVLDEPYRRCDLYLFQEQRCSCVFGLASYFGFGCSESIYIYIVYDFHCREKSLFTESLTAAYVQEFHLSPS